MMSFEFLSNMCIPGSLMCRIVCMCEGGRGEQKTCVLAAPTQSGTWDYMPDTVDLFHVRLMVICKENHQNTLVSMNRCNWKPPYDTFLWVARRPGEFGEIHWKLVGGICVWSSTFPVSHPQGWELQKNSPIEGWHHNESLQQVSWP